MKKVLQVLMVFEMFFLGLFANDMSLDAQGNETPFSILLLGVDTGEFDRQETGRSDVIMIMTVNPISKIVSLTSIPRDTYVNMPGYGYDKLNHAYAYGGPDLTKQIIENLLEIKVHYYVKSDMKGLKNMVNQIGGVDIVSLGTFSQNGFDFVKNQTYHLTGEMALAYARERYTSGGDYGRQARQRQIVESVLKKNMTFDSISDLAKTLSSLGQTFQTDIPLNKIQSVYRIMKNEPETNNQIDLYQLEGIGTEINGIYYEKLDTNALIETIRRLKQELIIE